MESNKENGINGIERHHQKIDEPLTKKDVQTILGLIPQGLDADEFIMRLCNEAVHYAHWLKKEKALQAMHNANKELGLYDGY
jgi:hypothetical protein